MLWIRRGGGDRGEREGGAAEGAAAAAGGAASSAGPLRPRHLSGSNNIIVKNVCQLYGLLAENNNLFTK